MSVELYKSGAIGSFTGLDIIESLVMSPWQWPLIEYDRGWAKRIYVNDQRELLALIDGNVPVWLKVRWVVRRERVKWHHLR